MRLNRTARSQVSDDLRDWGIDQRDRAGLGFQRYLDGDESILELTFDQALALNRRELTFVTPVHPLARGAVRYWTSQSSPLLSRLTVHSDVVPPGRYLFACDLWESVAVQSEVLIVSHVWDLERWCPNATVASSLTTLISHTEQAEASEGLDTETLEAAIGELDEQAHARFSEALDDLQERNEYVVTRRLASLNSYYTSRLQRIERELAAATEPRIQRMRTAERDRVEREYVTRQREIEDRRDADIVSKRVASGLLTIRPTHGRNDAI
jgi:ATP-dependent helicase HepA